MDELIEKNEEIIKSLHEFILKKFDLTTHDKSLTKIRELNYFKIIKSGIDKFDGEKIYLDTASVVNTDIVDETTLVSYENRPSRANMQPTKNSVWFAKLKDSPKYILVKSQSKRIIDRYIFSTGFFGLEGDENLINYLYAFILSSLFNNQKNILSNGATMQGINNDIFNEILAPNVVEHDAGYIGKELCPYVDLILNKEEEIYQLKKIKSNLLLKYFE